MDMESEAKYICLKLVTGETVMGVVESVNDDYFNIEEPVNISYDYDEDGNFGLKFVPYMSWCDKTLFTFNRRFVIMDAEPKTETIEFYKEFQLVRYEDEDDDDSGVIDLSSLYDKVYDKKKLH
jgi:hypothetical protein